MTLLRCLEFRGAASPWIRRLLGAVAVLLTTTGVACGVVAGAATSTPRPTPAPLLGLATPVVLGDDRLTLLRSGTATFEEVRALIVGARSTVKVEVYELGHRSLVDALLAAHGRGVSVTVIDDPSERNSAATTVLLRAAGIDVIDYPVRKLMIDHVKLLVVDGAVAVVGGINWGVKSPANHDYDAELRGPAVANLERVFERDLVTCGRNAAVADAQVDPAVLVAVTLPSAGIRPLALDLIDHARASIDLELFVLTDTGVVHALEAAHARGVRVRVLLDPSQPSSVPSFRALLAAGIEIRLYRSHGELLHAKALVADARAVLFGSANWSGGGFARNHELDIDLVDAPVVAGQMLAQMDLNWNASA